MTLNRTGLKQEAIRLRKLGQSLGDIEAKLKIPRSTLSGWLRSVPITKSQKARLDKRWREALVKARVEALKWHHAQKTARLDEAARQGKASLDVIGLDDAAIELALAMLYLGEGSKTNDQTSLASSDARIARFFVLSMRRLYGLPVTAIKCSLHLRADQDPVVLTRYWSRELGLPSSNFGKPSIDKRTIKSPTYAHYKGVCSVQCGRVAIQRRLMYIANGFCEKVVEAPESTRG